MSIILLGIISTLFLAMRYALQMVHELQMDSVESDNCVFIDRLKGKNLSKIYCDVVIGNIKAIAA